MNAIAAVPEHVARERVFDFDIYADPRITDDVQGSYAQALNAALGSAEVSEKLALVGDAPLRMSPAQFTRYVADQREAWGERVRIAGIEPQ